MQPTKIKEIETVIEHLKSIDYYNNKKESEVKRILLLNIERYKNNQITISFLAALCSELLYFNNNIGTFKDITLRNVLLKGDELSAMYSLEEFDKSKEDSLKQSILGYVIN